MARNRSMLGNPFVAGALTALGGYADRTSKDREDMRKFSQQQSIMNQKQLQENAAKSMESQLRLTEKEKMRQMQTTAPTPSELADQAASKATQNYWESRQRNQRPPVDPATAMQENMLKAVISAATTRVATDPEGALKMLKLHEVRFKGNEQYEQIFRQATELAEIAKEENKHNKELEMFNAAMRNADSANMPAAARIAMIGDNFENVMKHFPALVLPFFDQADKDIARESERRAGRAQDAVDAREDKLHKGWGKEAATDAELKKYLEEARAQQGVFQDSLDVAGAREKLGAGKGPVDIQREIGGLGGPTPPPAGGPTPPPSVSDEKMRELFPDLWAQRRDAQAQLAETVPPEDRAWAQSQGLNDDEIRSLWGQAIDAKQPFQEVASEYLSGKAPRR